MVEEKSSIPSKIPQLFTVLVRLVPLCPGLGKGHGLRCFACNANVVEVDGMVEFVFQGNDDDCVTGDLLVNGDVDAQKKPDDEQAYHNNNGNFAFFPAPHKHKALKSEQGEFSECTLYKPNLKLQMPDPGRLPISSLSRSLPLAGGSCRTGFFPASGSFLLHP